MSALNKDMEEVESMRKQLADFFCEDPVAFKLEECFKVKQFVNPAVYIGITFPV